MAIEFPERLARLFKPSRYKVIYGGRGSAKSWSVARALLLKAADAPLRVLCGRELQKSIRDSVHRLLVDQIEILGLGGMFDITQTGIKGVNGSEFFFESLRMNAAQIKSYEGVDIVWIEEAAGVSAGSWDVLIPTVRKKGSEIWITFNPELEDDETYRRFVMNTPPDAWVERVTWRDNPWFTEVLEKERVYCKETRPEDYEVIWEGRCRVAVEGAIYAKEILKATDERRITVVPVDKRVPVCTFWDLGYADMTSIWFVQKSGMEYRFVDFYQNNQHDIAHYVSVLQGKGYVYGTDYLPHDARARQLGTGRSIEEMMKEMGRRARIVPQLSIADGINAARMVFNACWFDGVRCGDGLQSLRRYRYEGSNREPLHDGSSHAADAFRYFAVEPDVAWGVGRENLGLHDDRGSGIMISDFDPLREEGLHG